MRQEAKAHGRTGNEEGQGHRKEQESWREGQVDLDQRQKQMTGSLDGSHPLQENRDLSTNSKE